MVTVKDPDGSEDDAPAGVVSLFDFTATDEESLFFKIELDIVSGLISFFFSKEEKPATSDIFFHPP